MKRNDQYSLTAEIWKNRRFDPQRSLELTLKLRKQAEEENDPVWLVRAKALQAIVSMAPLCDISGGKSLLAELEQDRAMAPDKETEAYILAARGLLYMIIFSSDKALEAMKRALDLSESESLDQIQPFIYGLMANMHLRMDDPHNAITYYNLAIDGFEALGFESEILFAKSNAIYGYNTAGQYEIAIELAQSVIDCDSEKYPQTFSQTLTNMAESYQFLGDYAKAIEIIRKAGNIEGCDKDAHLFTQYLLTHAGILLDSFRKSSDYNDPFFLLEAEEFILKARDLSQSNNFTYELGLVFRELSEVYELTGRCREALHSFREYHKITESHWKKRYQQSDH